MILIKKSSYHYWVTEYAKECFWVGSLPTKDTPYYNRGVPTSVDDITTIRVKKLHTSFKISKLKNSGLNYVTIYTYKFHEKKKLSYIWDQWAGNVIRRAQRTIRVETQMEGAC